MVRSRAVAPARGFTLVELMIVIAIVAFVVALASSSRFARGERTPAVARSLLQQAHQARQSAMALGVPARLRLTATAPYTVVSEGQDPTNAAAWQPIGGTTSLPSDATLCAVDAFTSVASNTPTCPITVATSICFLPSGRVFTTAGNTCPNTTAPTGATIYLASVGNAKQFKLPIFSLTGLPRLIDTW